MINETRVAISAVAPIAPLPSRRSWTARNGVRIAKTIVKMITATMNDVTSMSKPSSTTDATMRPTAFAATATNVRTMRRITRATLQHRCRHGYVRAVT